VEVLTIFFLERESEWNLCSWSHSRGQVQVVSWLSSSALGSPSVWRRVEHEHRTGAAAGGSEATTCVAFLRLLLQSTFVAITRALALDTNSE
jgi:hypothetical protein